MEKFLLQIELSYVSANGKIWIDGKHAVERPRHVAACPPRTGEVKGDARKLEQLLEIDIECGRELTGISPDLMGTAASVSL
jgi:hypothetical protein